MKKKKIKKPTGKIGPIIVSKDMTGFQEIAFPKNKEDIEKYIVTNFILSAQKEKILYFNIINHKQNDLDDFDYILETSIGPRYLELMEVAPLEHLQGSYKNAPNSYKPFEFADDIFKKILHKSTRYSGIKKIKIILLLYITHWGFFLDITTIALLQYWIAKNKNIFEYIYFYSPCKEILGRSNIIFPTPLDYWEKQRFNPEKYKDTIVHLLSPSKWKINKKTT